MGADCVLGDGLRFEGRGRPDGLPPADALPGPQPLSAVLAQVAARVGRDPEAFLPIGLESGPKPGRAGVPLADGYASRALGADAACDRKTGRPCERMS